MPKRIAEFCRETGQGTPETPGEIVRCIFDSLALRYRYTLSEVKSLTGHEFPHIHIVGGGVREEPLSRLAADATGTPVVVGPVEATATGNIAVQLIAAGELKDITEAREVISRSFETKAYEPDKSTSGAWDDAYAYFLDIIKRK
jgi:rhamnulokinase/L-fuculokinase